MDTLLINQKFDKKSFIETSQVHWEIKTSKNVKQIKHFLMVALIILAIGIITGVLGSGYAPFLIFIGIIALVVVAARIMSMNHVKKRYNKEVEEKIEELGKEERTYTFEFSDNSVKYHDKETDLELKWPAFKGYSIYKNHIVLVLKNSSTSFYVFGKEGTIDIEYEKILEFAKFKLPCIKIK